MLEIHNHPQGVAKQKRQHVSKCNALGGEGTGFD